MKTFLKFTALSAVLLMLAVGLASCNERENPVEVPFTIFSIAETSCHWVNLTYDNNVVIINSNIELQNYIYCSDSDFPEIDFSKYTLLLASGMTFHGPVVKISKCLLQVTTNEYRLDITVLYGDLTAPDIWNTALVIPKISDNCQIKLNVTMHNVW